MSQRRALAVEVWQLARQNRFPVLELERGFVVAHGPRPWRRFLEQAGNAELRAAVVALARLHHAQPTAGGGVTGEE
jgi:hypothetical protein